MSNALTALAVPIQLTPAQKATLLCLADHADDMGVCWPTIPRISEWTCLGRTAAIDALKALSKLGLVRVEPDGRRNLYRIQLDELKRRFNEADAAKKAAKAQRDADADRSGKRTGTEDGSVRQTDANGPADGLHQSGKRTTPVRLPDPEPSLNHQPQPPGEPPRGGRNVHIEVTRSTATEKRVAVSRLTADPKAPADFEAFWQAYPRKTAKKAAAKSWARLKPNPELVARILAALETAKTSQDWTRDDGRYVPYPATWLSGERWTDELAKSPADTRAARDAEARRLLFGGGGGGLINPRNGRADVELGPDDVHEVTGHGRPH